MLVGIWALALLLSAPHVVCDRSVDNFRFTPEGAFPVGWRTKYEHNAEEARQKGVYRVELLGDERVLHATYGTHTITIVLPMADWDLAAYPILQWRWRALVLPRGGDESARSTNDSAASVYVFWEAGWPLRVSAMRFSWSSILPVGHHISRRFGHEHVFIRASGKPVDGAWQTVRVNVRDLFRDVWGGDIKTPVGIALTTDGDDTHSAAEALYADFRLCRERQQD